MTRAFSRFLLPLAVIRYPSSASGQVLQLRLEQAAPFHSMQKRIKSSWSNAIAMMFKLLHHGEAENRLVGSVDKDMDANESGKQFSLLC